VRVRRADVVGLIVFCQRSEPGTGGRDRAGCRLVHTPRATRSCPGSDGKCAATARPCEWVAVVPEHRLSAKAASAARISDAIQSRWGAAARTDSSIPVLYLPPPSLPALSPSAMSPPPVSRHVEDLPSVQPERSKQARDKDPPSSHPLPTRPDATESQPHPLVRAPYDQGAGRVADGAQGGLAAASAARASELAGMTLDLGDIPSLDVLMP